MVEIHADYLGGHPLAGAGGASGLLTTSGGGLSFRGTAVDARLRPYRVALALAAADMEAASLGAADRMREALGEGAGVPLEAVADAHAGRDALLVVAARFDEADALVTFGVRPQEGMRLLSAMRRARDERGAAPLARLEGDPEGEEDRSLLREIRDLLREQNRLLGGRTPPPGGYGA